MNKVMIKNFWYFCVFVTAMVLGVFCLELIAKEEKSINFQITENEINKIPDSILGYFDKHVDPPKNLKELKNLVHLYLKENKGWDKGEYLIKLVNRINEFKGVKNVLVFFVFHKRDLVHPGEDVLVLDGGISQMVYVDSKKMEVFFIHPS